MVQQAGEVLPVNKMRLLPIPVEKLSPAPYNPRKAIAPCDVEYEKLKLSMATLRLDP